VKQTLCVAAIVIMAASGSTSRALQARPDFSGKWTAEAAPVPTATSAAGTPAPPAKGDMGSGWGSAFTITQNDKELVVEQALFSRYDLQGSLRLVYALDGSETRNAVMTGHSTQLRVSRTVWNGQSLRITTIYPSVNPASGQTFTTEVTQTLALESPAMLVVEVTRAGVLGGQTTTTRTVHRKG
jgi:hypothetical protein